NAGRGLTTTMDLGSPHIPGRQIGPSAQPLVFMLNADEAVGLRPQGGVAAMSGLNAGLLIGTEDTVLWGQGLTFPDAFVQVQNPPCLGLKVRVTRKDPTPMAPRLDSVLGEPAPKCSVADRSDEAPT
ncbi:MAG TPA: hypothetical protein VF756_10805, partial [Thermoanaerobaculia bacterium]